MGVATRSEWPRTDSIGDTKSVEAQPQTQANRGKIGHGSHNQKQLWLVIHGASDHHQDTTAKFITVACFGPLIAPTSDKSFNRSSHDGR